jgi:hypothetical protein
MRIVIAFFPRATQKVFRGLKLQRQAVGGWGAPRAMPEYNARSAQNE